jgi:molybdenum cofactor cytidylyltransferase
MIWAVVLAAGESKRMGEPKVLLPVGRKTMIESVLDHVIKSEVDGVLVVLGSHWAKVAQRIKKYPVKVTVNPQFKQGMLSSVNWGFKTLPPEAVAALFVLADQPRIPTRVLDKLLSAYKANGKGIVLPVYKGQRGHPVLIDRRYEAEARRTDSKIGLRNLVYGHPDDILEVEVSTPAIARDIDTPSDYERETGRGYRPKSSMVK